MSPMTEPSVYDPLIVLTQDNRELIALAGVGVCLACHAISPSSDFVAYRGDSAVCPQCDMAAVVPALTTGLLDAVASDVYKQPVIPSENPTDRSFENETSLAIYGEIYPLIERIEQRTGQKLMPALWAALTRSLTSMGASLETLQRGVHVQVKSQLEQNQRQRKH